MLALGLALEARGHAVTVLAGANFQDWIESAGLRFRPGLDMEAVMQSPEGVLWAESSDRPMRQLQMMKAIMERHREAIFDAIESAAEGAELLLSGMMTAPQALTQAEVRGTPLIQIALCPMEPTRSGEASMMAPRSRAWSSFNRLAGLFSQRVFWSAIGPTHNLFRARHGLAASSLGQWRRDTTLTPTLMAISPHVTPPASDWQSPTTVTGFWFLDDADAWQPSPELETFLGAGPAPVYVGFGSMSSSAPEQTASLIAQAARESGQRIVLAAGWTEGMPDLDEEQVFVLSSAPHSWLFPRCAGVIHHGGAGTTAAALRAGRPCWVVPHMSDQPYWGRRMHELGVGLAPTPRHKITTERLTHALRALGTRGALHEQAEALGAEVAAENGVERAVEAIAALV